MPTMTEKLIILPKKYKGETAVVSARLPNDIVTKLDRVGNQTGRTRNEIIALCLEFALEHIVVEDAMLKSGDL